MRILAKSTLRNFWSIPKYTDSEEPLKAWHKHTENANWITPTELKGDIRTASILQAGRAVFNIAGNKYRLVVQINYAYNIIYIRFVGTHKQYDEIDAQTI